MLLGDRSFVDHDRVVEYQQTGVYHVLVLAGLHVGALTAFFIWAGRRLRLALFSRTLLTLIALAAYVGIVEDRPPILRAALMAAIYLSARLLYRRMDLLNMAALCRRWQFSSRARRKSAMRVSCLSFSAVGIIGALAVPWICTLERALSSRSRAFDGRQPRRFARAARDSIPNRNACCDSMAFRRGFRALRRTVWTSICLLSRFARGFIFWELMVISAILQLGMLPPLAYYFHRVTLVGPLANIPAVLLTGLIVPLGFFTLAASLVSRALAGLLAKLLGFLLAMLDASVQWFARWHGASYRIPGPAAARSSRFLSRWRFVLSAAIRSRRTGWWQWAATGSAAGGGGRHRRRIRLRRISPARTWS